jgi:hypothetical protein
MKKGVSGATASRSAKSSNVYMKKGVSGETASRSAKSKKNLK